VEASPCASRRSQVRTTPARPMTRSAAPAAEASLAATCACESRGTSSVPPPPSSSQGDLESRFAALPAAAPSNPRPRGRSPPCVARARAMRRQNQRRAVAVRRAVGDAPRGHPLLRRSLPSFPRAALRRWGRRRSGCAGGCASCASCATRARVRDRSAGLAVGTNRTALCFRSYALFRQSTRSGTAGAADANDVCSMFH